MFLPKRIVEERLLKILAEDIGQGDVTSALISPNGMQVEATVIAREPGVAAGIEEIRTLMESLGIEVTQTMADGHRFAKNQSIMKISGDARVILSSERTVLNIISRMSGIATRTTLIIEKLRRKKLETKVACTRKTAPGLLYFDKKAVVLGGGDTHRLHLDDMILIKDNHIKIAGGVKQAIQRAKKGGSFSKKIEVEVTDSQDALTAASMGVDLIMFDNFPAKTIASAVKKIREGRFPGVLLEASGGITSENVLAFASTGVDAVSLGELTSNVRGLNVSLEITSFDKKHSR